MLCVFFFFQAEDGIRDVAVTGVQTCALPISGALSAADALRLRRSLAETAGHWNLMRIEREVVDRARSPFPGGPIRTRDALHLASAVVARAAVADLAFLSLDEKVRASGRALGLRR